MSEDRKSLIKTIAYNASVIFKCVMVTVIIVGMNALIIGLVVVQYPEDIMSYVVLSFILLVDGLLSFPWLASRFKTKYKPKTISKHLVFWLSMVLYCCLFAAACLTNALFMDLTADGKVVVPLFLCIFGGMGLADLGVLIYQIIGYVQIKLCLKYGEETTAEFVAAGKTVDVHYGKERRGTTVTGVSVIFKYVDSYGEQTEAASRRVFSWDEVDILEKMGTFKIKFDHRTAVILETFEPQDEEQRPSEPQTDDGQAEALSENKGE
ncbi:MAG: hypothetical protein K2I75_07170 [Clostridiales bacterium]|nr:hypothetical protein [Clostridiales bacterium]